MRILTIVLYILCLISCNCTKGEKVSVADTPENRQTAAMQLMTVYTTDEWKKDVIGRVEKETGKEVAEDFEQKMQKMYSPDEITGFRLKIITETFSANEISSLADFLKQSGNKSIIKKLKIADDKLKTAVAPELAYILSGEDK